MRNLGNLEGTLGTLGTFTWESGNLYLGPWEPLLGNLYLGTWEPLLGNLYLEPGNLGGMGFGAAPVCSETFTMAEDPKAFCCWGKIDHEVSSAGSSIRNSTWGQKCWESVPGDMAPLSGWINRNQIQHHMMHPHVMQDS